MGPLRGRSRGVARRVRVAYDIRARMASLPRLACSRIPLIKANAFERNGKVGTGRYVWNSQLAERAPSLAAREATPRLFGKSPDQLVLFSTRSTPISTAKPGSGVTAFTSRAESRHPIFPPHPIYRKAVARVLPRMPAGSIFPASVTQIETTVRVETVMTPIVPLSRHRPAVEEARALAVNTVALCRRADPL